MSLENSALQSDEKVLNRMNHSRSTNESGQLTYVCINVCVCDHYINGNLFELVFFLKKKKFCQVMCNLWTTRHIWSMMWCLSFTLKHLLKDPNEAPETG